MSQRTILVGTDGSDCSQRAIEYAAARASATGARLVVGYVIEWSQFSFSTPAENEVRHKRREEELDRAHSEVVDPVVKSLRDQGIDAEGVVRHGQTAEVLVDLAGEFEVEHIVIGRKGESRLRKMMFGSVAAALVQIADRPVTVVP